MNYMKNCTLELYYMKNVGGALHFIYYINRLTATKVD